MKVNDEDSPLSHALVDHLVLEAVIKHQHLSLSPGQVPLDIHLWSYSVVSMSQGHLGHSEHGGRVTGHHQGQVRPQLGVGQPIVRLHMGGSYYQKNIKPRFKAKCDTPESTESLMVPAAGGRPWSCLYTWPARLQSRGAVEQTDGGGEG